MFSINKKFPIVATLVAFVAIVIMLRLGFWQLDRMEAKQIRLSTLAQKLESGHASLVELPDALSSAVDMPVEFVGRLDAGRLLYLDNRILDGVVGYEVLAPAYTNVGWVLVNFGWIRATSMRSQLPEVDIDTLERPFKGNIVVPLLNPMVTETATGSDDFPMLIQQIDIAVLSKLTNLTLQPFIVALEADSSSPFKSNWRPVVMAPEKHFGYALQWFGLAIAALVIYLVALFKRKSH